MPSNPPNLRLSDSDEDCGGCHWFNKGYQSCGLYDNKPVDKAMCCDSYSPSDEKVMEDE